jgi:hypothetical protein
MFTFGYPIRCAVMVSMVLLSMSQSAWAADKFDTWTDVYTIPGFTFASIEEQTKMVGPDQARFQIVRGRIDGQDIWLRSQKFDMDGGVSKASVNTKTRSLKALEKSYGIKGGSNFHRISGPGISGGEMDYKSGSCRLVSVGADRKSDWFNLSVILTACGVAKDKISEYARRIKASDRAKNTADFAAFSRSTIAPPSSGKPKFFSDCVEAKVSPARMADFMQALPPERLVEFLSASQSCDVFANG